MGVRYLKDRRRYVADYRDGAGIRRCPTFRLRKDAAAHYRAAIERRLLPGGEVLIRDYAPTYLARVKAASRPNTIDRISSAVRVHVLPALGGLRLSELTRGRVMDFIGHALKSGHGQGSALNLLGVVSGIVEAAIDDESLSANPCYHVARKLGLSRDHRVREGIKALTEHQAPVFLAGCGRVRQGELLKLLMLTGARPGEGAALRWQDLDLDAGRAQIVRSYSNGHLGPPKTGPRPVTLSPGLVEILKARRARALADGSLAMGWCFPTTRGRAIRTSSLNDAMGVVLRSCGLPEHLTPHCLRHTFAYLHLKVLRSDIRWVKEQLGHASITVTYDIYGDWLPMADDGEPARLDGLLKAKSGTDAAVDDEISGNTIKTHFSLKTTVSSIHAATASTPRWAGR